jgi:hypothetical protein
MAKKPLRWPRPSSPVVTPPEQPGEPCYACGRAGWWLLPDGSAWRCTLCHPAPGAHHAVLALAGDRLALVRAAARLGYPRWPLSAWRAVAAGESAWRAFALGAPPAAVAALLAALAKGEVAA